MKTTPFFVINSFVEKLFRGNPAAVFTDSPDFDLSIMQTIAKQMNPAKTIFIHPITQTTSNFHFRSYRESLPELPVQPVLTGLGHLIVPLKSSAALMRVQRRIEPLKNFTKILGS